MGISLPWNSEGTGALGVGLMRGQKGPFLFEVIGMSVTIDNELFWFLQNHSGVSILLKLLHLSKSEAGVIFHSKERSWVAFALPSWPYYLCFL